MKNLTICLLLPLLVFASCEQEQVVDQAALPAAEKQYLDIHFPSVPIVRVVQERNDNITTYQVWLENLIEVEFDAHGQVASIDGQQAQHLPDSVIPASILEYVYTRHVDQYVVEWEKDKHKQEVQLSSGIELIFDLNGTFLRIDD